MRKPRGVGASTHRTRWSNGPICAVQQRRIKVDDAMVERSSAALAATALAVWEGEGGATGRPGNAKPDEPPRPLPRN